MIPCPGVGMLLKWGMENRKIKQFKTEKMGNNYTLLKNENMKADIKCF